MGEHVFGDIMVDQYKRRLTKLGKRARTDENLAEELVFEHMHMPKRAPNGVRLQHKGGVDMLVDHIAETSGTGYRVHLLILSPDGKSILEVRE